MGFQRCFCNPGFREIDAFLARTNAIDGIDQFSKDTIPKVFKLEYLASFFQKVYKTQRSLAVAAFEATVLYSLTKQASLAANEKNAAATI